MGSRPHRRHIPAIFRWPQIEILTATEYFTKWVEAIPMRSTTSKAIKSFLLQHIIARFGTPLSITTDNGTPFKNRDITYLYMPKAQHPTPLLFSVLSPSQRTSRSYQHFVGSSAYFPKSFRTTDASGTNSYPMPFGHIVQPTGPPLAKPPFCVNLAPKPAC